MHSQRFLGLRPASAAGLRRLGRLARLLLRHKPERIIVLVVGFATGVFGANCYVAAPAAGEQCVIVDPGQDAVSSIADVLREHRLKPVAVLLTHGHLDHTWWVLPVGGAHDVPALIHPADRGQLPGHGPRTTIGRERVTSPYLQALQQQPAEGVRR